MQDHDDVVSLTEEDSFPLRFLNHVIGWHTEYLHDTAKLVRLILSREQRVPEDRVGTWGG